MDTYKDYLSAALSEAVIRLIDTLDQPSPFRCDNENVVHYGHVREQYGIVCGLERAAELADIDYTEIQATKEQAAKERNTNWDAVLHKIQY